MPLDGIPSAAPAETSISRIDRPMITSGITSGAVISAPNTVLPGNRRKRVITIAPSVPMAVAAVAVQKAIRRLTQAASRICRSRSSSPYHLVEKPAQTVARREELTEYTSSSRIGW